MAYYGGQFGHYPQGYGNQGYHQYNNYSNSSTSGSQSSSYGYASTSAVSSGSHVPVQSYNSQSSQPYNYGYNNASSTSTNTATTQQGTSYQQFSNLWYGQTSSSNAAPTQQQSASLPSQQQQGSRNNQQVTPGVTAFQLPMNQYYPQPNYVQQQQRQPPYQQHTTPPASQQYKPSNKSHTAALNHPRQPSTAPQAQAPAPARPGEWTNNVTSPQRGPDAYSNYSSPPKLPPGQNWGNFPQQQGKDWAAPPNAYPQQHITGPKNGYHGNAGGDYSNASQQLSTIQQQPQLYASQQRNYQLQPQQYQANTQGYHRAPNNPTEMHRGYGERSQGAQNHGVSHDNRGNWNVASGGAQNNWNNAGQGNWQNGGWGDWGGSRNNPRRVGDDGPHIPPFPPAWQMGSGAPPPQPPPAQQGGNRVEPNRGNRSGNNWNQNWDNNPNGGRTSGNNNRFSRGDGQQNNRFQNNGRYSPNSRQSRGTAGEKTNRELWSPADTKRNKEKTQKEKDNIDVEKPIQANEIKSYLYAWLGVRRMRPSYDILPVGERPDQTFRCELRVNGYKFVGVGEAPSKKDAQTDAAWNFAEFLVKQGQLKKADLPPKSKNFDESANEFGTVKDYEQEKEKPRGNRQRGQARNQHKGGIPSLMSIVTSPMGNIPPYPAFERPPNAWGMPPPPPHRRGGHGPWMEEPHGSWRSGHRAGWSRHDHWRQREIEEQMWIEEMQQEFQHPEDIFISRMIMNQQEAAMGSRRFEGRPGEWTSVAPARARNQTTLDDRHVMGKHGAIYPHEEELKAVHRMVTVAERALKALSDQFVDEDHPIPKDEDDETEDEQKKEQDEGENSEEAKKDSANEEDKSEKKTKIQILKRPKKRPRRVPDLRPRVLCAVNRVGTLAKGLLIHGDLNVCLVLLCGSIPTRELLDRILKHLPAKISEVDDDFKYELKEEEAGFLIVNNNEPAVTLSVTLTFTSLKAALSKQNKNDEGSEEDKEETEMEMEKEEGSSAEGENAEEPTEVEIETGREGDQDQNTEEIPGMLPKSLLLGALAQLRHAKWFQARASQQDCGVIITRIIRNLKLQNPIWSPLSNWALENLVYVALSSSTEHMSPGDALRRFFEVVAGGVLLKDRSGIQDPCEREEVDVLDCCTDQQLEDITRHAQNSLLKIAFRKIHEVLDMDKISVINRFPPTPNFPSPNPHSITAAVVTAVAAEEDEREGGRKRRLEHNSSDSQAESPKRSLTDEEDTDTQQNLAELTISDQTRTNIPTDTETVSFQNPETADILMDATDPASEDQSINLSSVPVTTLEDTTEEHMETNM